MKYTLNDIFKKQKGFALLTVILSTVLMLILGFTIIWVTTSNFKMTKIDSLSQSAYYIAEAGINYMIDKINTEVKNSYENFDSNEAFFEYIEDEFIRNKIFTFDELIENNGKQPKASVIVDMSGENPGINTRYYRIESVGEIGSSKRTVSAVVSIDWFEQENNILSDLLLNTNKFVFGGSEFNAPGKTIVISGQEGDSINGGAYIKTKNIYFKDLENGVISGKSYGDENDPGDIYLDGNARILDSGRIIHGNVHTNGDFIVTGGVTINGNLYVGGKFEVTGGSNIYGDVYVKDFFQIKGGATIHGNVYAFKGIHADGNGRIKGNLNVEGNSKLIGITVEGLTNVKGNLELDWTPNFIQNVKYTGNLATPNNFNQGVLDKCSPVLNIPDLNKHEYSFEIPNCIASLKHDSWYEEKGYEIKEGYITSKIPQNAKWVVDNYNNTSYQEMNGEIIIISKGDIILRGEDSFSGALIAPNGIVKYTGGNFKGIIISNQEVSLSGWGSAEMKGIDEYFDSLNIPVIIDCGNNNDSENNNGSNNSINAQIIIKSGIKEK